VDLKFPRGRGDQVKKSWKFQGVGGNHVKPSGMENPGGWGLKQEKTLRGGYGYFLEPHITDNIVGSLKSGPPYGSSSLRLGGPRFVLTQQLPFPKQNVGITSNLFNPLMLA